MFEIPEFIHGETGVLLALGGLLAGVALMGAVALVVKPKSPPALREPKPKKPSRFVAIGKRVEEILSAKEIARAKREEAARLLEDKEIPAEIDPRLVARVGHPIRQLPVTLYTAFVSISMMTFLLLGVLSIVFGPWMLWVGGAVGMFLMATPNLLQFRLRRIVNKEDPDASRFHIVPPHPAIVQFLTFHRNKEFVVLAPTQMNGQMHYLLGPAELPYVKIGKRIFRIPRHGTHEGSWSLQAPEGLKWLRYPPGVSEPEKQPGFNEAIWLSMQEVAEEMKKQMQGNGGPSGAK